MLGLWAASISEAPKTASAPTKVRRAPKVSISHAFNSMPTVIAASMPVDSHCARSWPTPNAPMMSGIATLTEVVVRTAEIWPSITVIVANQR